MSSAGPSRLTLEDTPMRPPPPPKFRPSPKKLQRASQSPDKKKKTLPGFQNSFLTSTPVRSPSSSKFKEKEKEKDDLDFWDTPSRPVSSQRQHTTGMQAPLFPVVPDFPATVYEPPPFPPTAVEMPPPASSPIPEDNLVLETVEDEDELEDLPAHSWKSEVSRRSFASPYSWLLDTTIFAAITIDDLACSQLGEPPDPSVAHEG